MLSFSFCDRIDWRYVFTVSNRFTRLGSVFCNIESAITEGLEHANKFVANTFVGSFESRPGDLAITPVTH
jgi:hypothetical protein